MIRYEIARTDAGHFARFIAANGKEVWRTSEVYTRRRAAENAIETITGRFIQHDGGPFPAYIWHHDQGQTEVRYIDERLHKVERPELPAVGA